MDIINIKLKSTKPYRGLYISEVADKPLLDLEMNFMVHNDEDIIAFLFDCEGARDYIDNHTKEELFYLYSHADGEGTLYEYGVGTIEGKVNIMYYNRLIEDQILYRLISGEIVLNFNSYAIPLAEMQSWKDTFKGVKTIKPDYSNIKILISPDLLSVNLEDEQ